LVFFSIVLLHYVLICVPIVTTAIKQWISLHMSKVDFLLFKYILGFFAIIRVVAPNDVFDPTYRLSGP
jgi:hypothetical protein